MTGPAGSALRLAAFAGGGGTRHHRPLRSGTVHRARAAGPDGCEATGCADRGDAPGGAPGAARRKDGKPL
ncbi:hypothetical protein SUDANB6_05379 [Streptomyces sp. enrichment culture]|uniref:hypothetical protein n=1 Tax=Streptomyces sp. enrichment culture TaxID=1795815 RepID=UPI003F56B3A7